VTPDNVGRVRTALSFSERVDAYSHHIIQVTALLYVAGFVVATVYYSQFDVTSLALLRPQYVLAGFWFFLPLIIVASVFVLAYAYYQSWHVVEMDFPKSRSLRFAVICLSISGLMMAVLAVTFALDPFLTKTGRIRLNSAAWVGSHLIQVLSQTVPILGFGALLLWAYRDPGGPTWRKVRIAGRLVGCSVLLVFALHYLQWFGTNVFPAIPQSIGGGQPLLVQFILKAEGQPGEQTLSEPWLLILEEPETYVIVLPTDKTTVRRITKDLYRGYVVAQSADKNPPTRNAAAKK
jgi:hypothetical protein